MASLAGKPPKAGDGVGRGSRRKISLPWSRSIGERLRLPGRLPRQTTVACDSSPSPPCPPALSAPVRSNSNGESFRHFRRKFLSGHSTLEVNTGIKGSKETCLANRRR